MDTSIILKSVLGKDKGLRTGNILSHVAVFDIKMYDRLFFITDVVMNLTSDLNSKKQIIENSCKVSNVLDIDIPKVPIICADEKVNPKMKDIVNRKSLVFFSVSKNTGVIVPVKVRIILVLRIYNEETKLNSITLGTLIEDESK